MPASKVQLINGTFQDSEGNVLANGYLVMELNQDGMVTGVGQVCAGIKIVVPLNSSGNVVTSPAVYVWPNDVILPINSFYNVSGYTANGQLAWGPNNQQVLHTPSPFDLDAWIPNQLTNWTPPLTVPTLETNGVLNGLQSLLDLIEGDGISIVDDGLGGVTITGISLKHNTIANGSQTLLDLTNGTGITITDNGSGVITVAVSNQPYDIGIPIVDQPSASESIGYVMPRAVMFPADFSTSYAQSGTASAGTIVFQIKKNGSQIGTVTFTASSTGVFASSGGLAQSFAAGDLFELVCPASVDATWANGRFSIVGTR